MKALARRLVPRSLVIAVALICVGCGAPGGSAGAAPASASTPAAVPSAAAVSTATALPSATAGPSATVLPTPSASSAPTAFSITDISSLRQGIYVACDANDVNKNCITPGTYRLSGGPSVWPVTVTIDVPAHWFEYEGATGFDGVLVQSGPPDYSGTGWGAMFTTVGDVSRNPCDASKGVIPAAQVETPERLAAAMARWPKFKETSPQAITVDGHPGLKFVMTSTAASTCAALGSIWQTTSGMGVDVYPMITDSANKGPGTFEIVDTGHGLLVIRTGGVPYLAGAADQTALKELLDSIRLIAQPG